MPKLKPKVSKINEAVERAILKLLKDVMDNKSSSLIDKTRVLDRALKLEAIKARLTDDDEGAFFKDDPEADDATE